VKPVNIIKILRAAAKADPLLTKIISNVVARL
jgi:hypothetical protein